MNVYFSHASSHEQADGHAVLLHDDGRCVVRMLDISDSGARIDCDDKPAVGSIVTLILLEERTPARVAWTGGKMAGLQFLRARASSAIGNRVTASRF